jgi:hypothetical protein
MKGKKKQLSSLLRKKAKRGFRGYPLATVAFYGPNDKLATKIAVGIIPSEGAEPSVMKRWRSEGTDIKLEPDVGPEIIDFIESNGAKSVVTVDRIIGCPHEEGVDYPEGQHCPECPFWAGRDRWTGESIH